MKIIHCITRWLFILCLPVLLLTASITLAFNSQWFYEYGFRKYDISRTTGLAPAELSRAARGLIDYFDSRNELISITLTKDGKPFALFNEREVIHLKDVKALVWLDYKVALGTLLYALGYAAVLLWRKNRQQLARGLRHGGILTLTLGLLSGLGILLNFERLFWQFHLISFNNDFWQLNPATDYLIMLFPGGFWFDAAIFIALLALGMALILGGTGFLMIRHE
ncbi:MAG: TIGR01906 family membrane protein [Dehalococcoidales bacterium]|nr:TIGR01906 family membrane protein [Dehalococcoidales bacterium]